MKTILPEKPRMTPITDPAEIASLEHGQTADAHLADIIGVCVAGCWWAYDWSVQRFRAVRRAQNGEKDSDDRH